MNESAGGEAAVVAGTGVCSYSGLVPDLVYSQGVVARGSTDPVLLVDSEGHAWITKLQPAPMLDHVAELVVAHLAAAVGIATPPFAIGTVDRVLAEALIRGELREARLGRTLQTRGLTLFASRWLSGAHDVTSPPIGADDFLSQVLCLDLLVANPDRRHDHPNLLRSGVRLLAMDHAQALPWCRGQAVSQGLVAQHVATSLGLRPATLFITEDQIKAAVEAVPADWWPRPDARDATLDALVERATVLSQGGIP